MKDFSTIKKSKVVIVVAVTVFFVSLQLDTFQTIYTRKNLHNSFSHSIFQVHSPIYELLEKYVAEELRK